MAVEFPRRSISRRSIHRTSQAAAFSTRVSEVTLCLLGQSNKAIGHESRIGPCVATHPVHNSQACSFRKRWASSPREMEPQGRGSVSSLSTRRRNRSHGLGVHAQTVGLNALTTMARHRANGKDFSLDIPFYRTCLCSRQIGQMTGLCSKGWESPDPKNRRILTCLRPDRQRI